MKIYRPIALALLAALLASTAAPVRASGHRAQTETWVARRSVENNDVNGATAGTSCRHPDYIADATAADVQIQLAIDHTHRGGTIHLCAGVYNISAHLMADVALTFKGQSAYTTILDGGDAVDPDPLIHTDGHGILVSVGNLVVRGLTFQNAYGEGDGGAIYAYEDAKITDCTFADNTAGSAGGAIYVDSTATVTSSTFAHNAAENGGAIAAHTATVTSGTFTDNSASQSGGAISVGNGIVATNSIFTTNTAEAYGGAINSGGAASISRSLFANNSSSYGGGAITSSPSVTVTSSAFTSNAVTGEGGGGAILGNSVTATDSTFKDNAALNDQGGAIYAVDATVTRSTFKINVGVSGGAIFAEVSVTATRSTFIRNVDGFGGGIGGGAIRTETATVTRSIFTENSATAGGAIFAETGMVARSRFMRNTAVEHGGAIWFSAPNSNDLQQLRSNIFTRNTAAAGGAIALGPCVAPTRSQVRRVEQSNSFSRNQATVLELTKNIERLTGDCR